MPSLVNPEQTHSQKYCNICGRGFIPSETVIFIGAGSTSELDELQNAQINDMMHYECFQSCIMGDINEHLIFLIQKGKTNVNTDTK